MSTMPTTCGVCPRHEEVSAEACAETGCTSAQLWIAAPRMRAALELVADMDGKTLIYDPAEDRAVRAAYSLGAARAFVDAAHIAKAALRAMNVEQQP